MSCHIYEDLVLGMNVWYSKGAQANQQEKAKDQVVEIYEPSDNLPDLHVAPFTQDGSKYQTALFSIRSWYNQKWPNNNFVFGRLLIEYFQR